MNNAICYISEYDAASIKDAIKVKVNRINSITANDIFHYANEENWQIRLIDFHYDKKVTQIGKYTNEPLNTIPLCLITSDYWLFLNPIHAMTCRMIFDVQFEVL
jgi:hypothetical protein